MKTTLTFTKITFFIFFIFFLFFLFFLFSLGTPVGVGVGVGIGVGEDVVNKVVAVVGATDEAETHVGIIDVRGAGTTTQLYSQMLRLLCWLPLCVFAVAIATITIAAAATATVALSQLRHWHHGRTGECV